jgi:CubicO group peptidase (beta-lactamase class C family)
MTMARVAQRLGLALLATAVLLSGCGGDSASSAPSPASSAAPVAGQDWPTSTPEEQGLDGEVLAGYVARITSGTYGDVHSLLVVRHGRLVTESYFRGWDLMAHHEMYSVTKSVTSLLVGIARDDGWLPPLDTLLLTVFPEYPTIANMSPEKAAITLEDVLTMRAGFQWDEGSTNYADPANPVVDLIRSPDWVKHVLDLPMSHPPGTVFRYNSGCTMVLGGVLRNTTGQEAHDLARDRLFGPLGIASLQWETGAQGLTNTGWGLHLRPRDMAKVGELVLRRGQWGGQRVVSEGWLALSTARHVTRSSGSGYGYQWWHLATETGVPDVVFASGWGGQLIFVVPGLDLVVVSTAGEYSGRSGGALEFIRPLLRDVVR